MSQYDALPPEDEDEQQDVDTPNMKTTHATKSKQSQMMNDEQLNIITNDLIEVLNEAKSMKKEFEKASATVKNLSAEIKGLKIDNIISLKNDIDFSINALATIKDEVLRNAKQLNDNQIDYSKLEKIVESVKAINDDKNFKKRSAFVSALFKLLIFIAGGGAVVGSMYYIDDKYSFIDFIDHLFIKLF